MSRVLLLMRFNFIIIRGSNDSVGANAWRHVNEKCRYYA